MFLAMTAARFLFPVDAGAQTEKLKERSEIDHRYQWKTDHIFSSDSEWESSLARLKSMLSELDRYQGRLHESPDTLLAALQTRDKIDIWIGKLSMYAGLKADEDTRITKYQAYRDRIASLAVQINQKKSYIEPEILRIAEDKIREFTRQNNNLAQYRHYLDDLLRSREHVLDQAGEQLLALAGDLSRSPYQIFSMFNNADIRFPSVTDETGQEVEITKANIFLLLKSPNREVRREAYTRMYQTYRQWTNTLSASLAAAVKRDVFYARARKYPGALEASLDTDNIPPTVYLNVIETLNKNLAPMHQYISLRKEILGLDKVYPWDLFIPLLKDYRWEVSYQEAASMIPKALQPLGEEYGKIVNEGFAGGWFDVFENQGKRSGAYSTAAYDAPHPYMLLNYQGMLDDVFTVAHEMGHSIHSYYTLRNQPYIYSDYTIFVAEVASTLNEALLVDYLLKTTTDKQKKLFLLNQYIDQIRGTLYIQAIFAEFEKTIHEKYEAGEALTAELYNQITSEIYSRYYGPDFEMDPLYQINWCRIPHFYYNFYVYQYATGISAATSLAQKIIAGDKKARDAYLKFLKQGNSDYSINLLKDAGVDMTSPRPIEETTQLFSRLLDEMQKLLREN